MDRFTNADLSLLVREPLASLAMLNRRTTDASDSTDRATDRSDHSDCPQDTETSDIQPDASEMDDDRPPMSFIKPSDLLKWVRPRATDNLLWMKPKLGFTDSAFDIRPADIRPFPDDDSEEDDDGGDYTNFYDRGHSEGIGDHSRTIPVRRDHLDDLPMWVTYTISEDRSDGMEGLQNTRLAALNARFCHQAGYGLKNDPRLQMFMHGDAGWREQGAFEVRLMMYCRREDVDDMYICLVPDCTHHDGFDGTVSWIDHVKEHHDEWRDELKEEMGIPLSPLNTDQLEVKDIELVQSQTSCSFRKAVKALLATDNDIVDAIMRLAR